MKRWLVLWFSMLGAACSSTNITQLLVARDGGAGAAGAAGSVGTGHDAAAGGTAGTGAAGSAGAPVEAGASGSAGAAGAAIDAGDDTQAEAAPDAEADAPPEAASSCPSACVPKIFNVEATLSTMDAGASVVGTQCPTGSSLYVSDPPQTVKWCLGSCLSQAPYQMPSGEWRCAGDASPSFVYCTVRVRCFAQAFCDDTQLPCD